MSTPSWDTATTQLCPGPSEWRLPCSPALSSVQQPVKMWGLHGAAGVSLRGRTLSHQITLSLSLFCIFLSVNQGRRISVLWAWAGRTRSVQGEHVEGAWHLASTPEPSSDWSTPGLRRLLLSPLRFRAREGWTSGRDTA